MYPNVIVSKLAAFSPPGLMNMAAGLVEIVFFFFFEIVICNSGLGFLSLVNDLQSSRASECTIYT